MAVQLATTHPSSQKSPRPAITLRHAKPSDAASISQIGAYTFGTTFGYSMPPADLKAYLDSSYSIEATTKDISDPNKDMVVATITPPQSQPQSQTSTPGPTEEDTVVGFALLTRGTTEPCLSTYSSDTIIELQRLYIHPQHQGLGAGNLLARELESLARRLRYKYMWLGVWEENFKAQKVYGKLGYKRVGEHEFVMGEEIQTDWILVKEL